ncbi:MAG: DUF1638 domain-containing protein [Thermoleophilia bacterium]
MTSGRKTETGAKAGPAGGRVIVACEMIEDEVRLAYRRVFSSSDGPPIVWVESGLHDYPDALRRRLQELIDRLDESAELGRAVRVSSVRTNPENGALVREELEVGPAAEVVLAFGYCGAGLKDLVAQNLWLVFPRVDDCISLFLNCGCSREEIRRDPRAYYLTRGWLQRPEQSRDSYSDWVARYGEERARRLRQMMYAQYERVTLIDTGAYDFQACLPESRAFAAEIELEHDTVGGSLQLLERLFRSVTSAPEAGSENAAGEIVRLCPGEPVSFLHLVAS